MKCLKDYDSRMGVVREGQRVMPNGTQRERLQNKGRHVPRGRKIFAMYLWRVRFSYGQFFLKGFDHAKN
jgi:hypothetical protein